MTQEFCLLCLVMLSYLRSFNAAFIPLRPLIPSTSTYKPSTLLLPPGFESPKAPPEPMLYPYAVPSTGISTAPQMKMFSSTTPDWIPVALNVNKDLHLKRTISSTSSTPSAPVLEDRSSNDELSYSSPAYKGGPVFESIVYGTWKPDPPLEPPKTENATSQPQIPRSKSDANGTAIGSGKVYNKTINRQHGGFIGSIQQKPLKTDRQSSLTTSPVENKSKEPKLQGNVKKQGRRKIRPNMSTTEKNSNQNSEKVATSIAAATKEYSEPHQHFIKVNTTDPKLMEVAKQINESLEIKYNHKQTSTHSIDMMTTTAEANNYDDDHEADDYDASGRFDASNVQWATKANEFVSTEPQLDYDDADDYAEEEVQNINATRRSWPADFVEEPLRATDVSYPSANALDEVRFNDSILEPDPSEIPLALSALNIPPSLWPKLPGNITKLGKPYEAESSAEEPAICVPITVREPNVMNSNELIYIERIFCFPMPLSTTSEKSDRTWENAFASTTTLKTVTTTKVQNFDDFAGSNPTASSKANNFKNNIFLAAALLGIYWKFIV